MKIIFAGTPDFAVPSLQSLLESQHDICAVYTQPDRPSGRGQKTHPNAVKQLALAAAIPVLQPLSLKTTVDFQQLAAFNADLIVVVAYGMILPQSVLDLPRLGCINVHGSLLPRWRGAAPIQRALMAGDDKTGVTIMKIVLKLDAGDMLHKEECVINPQDTASDLHDKLAILGARGLMTVINQIESGSLRPEQQDETQVTYAEKLSKAEAVINWSEPADCIARKIQGLNAWPVAQTLYRGEVLRLWRAEALCTATDLAPGTVSATQKHMDVATGRGWLRVQEVQLPGGKRQLIQTFLNAHPMTDVKLG